MVYPHGSSSIVPASRLLIRARVVLPVSSPPLEDGAVLISRGRLACIGPASALREEPHESSVDLGEVVLMPGLVNAHCHFDYTDMAGQIRPPKSFSDWLKAMLASKADWSYSDYAASWLHGARMLLNHGTSTVGDAEAIPDLLPEVSLTTPLRVCSLLEMASLRRRRPAAEILRDTANLVDKLTASACWAGLSPHATYSTTPELLRLTAKLARERNWLVATHVAESAEEFEMFMSARGPMFDWLKSMRKMGDCGRGSPVRHLSRMGLVSRNLIAVHANYLAPGDADLLGRAGATVVHCPSSHAYFGHDPFPYAELARAGVNLCIGTDSLASVRCRRSDQPELNLFAEVRTFSQRHREVSPETLVRLITMNGARALGMARRLGELSPDACADLAVIPFSGSARDAWNGVLHHQGPVSGLMINGRWVIEPSGV